MPLDLARDIHGDALESAPLIVLHGLFGQKRNWSSLAKQMGRKRRVIVADLRNHGDSPWDDIMTYDAMAEDLAALIDAEASGHAQVLGHSMGGKAAMALAFAHPEKIEKLCVADIAPVVRGGTDVRRYAEMLLALPADALASRSQADAALAKEIPEAPIRAFLLQNLDPRAEPPGWKPNLAVLHERMDDIEGFVDTDNARPYDGPTLFIAGGASPYIQPKHHAEIERLFPNANIEIIDKAGHWVHAERPREFLALAEAFLDG